MYSKRKNREVFKYIFNVLDSGISEIEVDIASKTQEKTQIASQYSAVSNFLSQTEFKSAEDLDEEISNIDNIKIEVKDQLSDLKQKE